MKNKYIAAALAFVGGVFGLHKFYLGEVGAGIFYTFLTIMTSDLFPLSAILGAIDGIRLLMMPQEEFNRKFNKRYRSSRKRKVNTRRSREVDSYQSPKTKTKRRVARSNPFKKSAIKKYKEYDIEGAIEDFHKALKIDANDVSIYCQSTTDSPVEKPMDDVLLAQLNRLMELRKKGVLTEQEFLRERKKVLVR